MSKLSHEQIDNLVLILELNGRVLLRCDGYQIVLCKGELTRYHPYENIDIIQIYIDGKVDVRWCNYTCEQSKFFVPLLVDGNRTLYQPYFFAAREALEHINAASDNAVLLRTQNSAQWSRPQAN